MQISFLQIFPIAQMVKNVPAMQKIRVQSLEKGITIKGITSILAWRIPWTEEPGGHSPWGLKESDTIE